MLVGIRITARLGHSDIFRKIENGGFDQFIQAVGIKGKALFLQELHDIGFLFCAAPAPHVKLFGGFDGNCYPQFDFLQLVRVDLAFQPRDHKCGNDSRDKGDNRFNNRRKINHL